MNNKKQSSVEWLFVELWNTPKDKFEWQSIFEQAKAMHKEEIMDAFQHGKWDWHEHLQQGTLSKDPAEYYKETFELE